MDTLLATPLLYQPPYACPAADEFAWHLVKVLDLGCGLAAQVPVQTPAGPVCVDFVVEAPLPDGQLRRVGFVLLGPHEYEAHADRVAPPTEAGSLDALYFFAAADVLTRLADVLVVVSGWEPSLFSLRGRTNIERLASADALLTPVAPDLGEVVVVYHGGAQSAHGLDAFEAPAVTPGPLSVRRTVYAPEAAVSIGAPEVAR